MIALNNKFASIFDPGRIRVGSRSYDTIAAMKKILIVLVILVGSIIIWNLAKPDEVKHTIKAIEETVSNPQITYQTEVREYVFIPYWSFTKNIVTDSDYSLLYFGLGVDESGIIEDDEGYNKIEDFISYTPNASERILSVRMTDKFVNAAVLENLKVQRDIATRSVELAEKYGFDGVLLDYETSAFGFESTTKNILSFYELFAEEVKSANLLFYVTLYGDNYFRARPYDVKRIGDLADKVIIMAYDFSKSRGNPGPNFPLYDTNGVYGYDLTTMVDDFQRDIDNLKLVIALGYFGYDWKVDVDGTATSNGIPLSTNEIKQNFVDECKYYECVFNRLQESLEPSIFYKDRDGNDHIVWFEDEQSVMKKKKFLEEKGILETAAWAYSYY